MQFRPSDGKKLFVLTPGTLYWCELGIAAPPMPIGPMPPFPPAIPPRPGVTPDPKATNDILAGESRKVEDADVTTLRVTARELIEGMCWAADGKSFYCAERSGIIRRIAVNGLKEEARLDIGQSCYNMALSSEGPVVAVLQNGGEVWLLDAGSLKVKRKVPVTTLTRVTAAPSSATAFAVSMGAASEQVSVIDLKEGKVLNTIRKPDAGGPASARRSSPDGKYLFGVNSGILPLPRREDRLIFEESGPKPNTVRQLPAARYRRPLHLLALAPTPQSARNPTIPVYEVSNLRSRWSTSNSPSRCRRPLGSTRKDSVLRLGARARSPSSARRAGKEEVRAGDVDNALARQILVHPEATNWSSRPWERVLG
jgi:hypothetical protein